MTAQATAFRVLTVDATNTGRSAAGERLLRKHLHERGVEADAIRITSAGLNAEDGASMQPAVAAQIERHGANPHGFVARSLSEAIVEATDFFLCGNGIERDELLKRYPRARGRSFTFAEAQALYRDVVHAVPLHQHAAMLERRRASGDYAEDWDLPDWDQADARMAAMGERMAQTAETLADMWAAMVPAQPRTRPRADGPTYTLEAFGTPIDIHCAGSGSEALAAIGRKVWARCLVEGREPEVGVDVVVDTDPAVLAQARMEGALAYQDVDTALHHLSSAVTVRGIEAKVGGPVLLHAAALASPAGDVVGFIAPSGTGKTTLARTLGAHYGYVTDETLAIDAGRTVRPFPKPLSIIDGHAHLKEQWSPDSLDLVPLPPGRLRLTRLVIIERDPAAPETPEISELPLLHGLAQLAEQVSYLSRLPRQLHTLSDLVDSLGGLVRIRYREARDLIPLMPALFEGAR